MAKKVWTRKKLRILRQEYPTADLRKLAETLGVTYSAVKSRASMMHLRREVNVKHVWTADEEALLRERYAETDTHELAAIIGASYSSVSNKANLLGLFKSHEYISRTCNPGGRNGIATRFKPGRVPANKGKKASEFRSKEGNAKCAATQFKPGHHPYNTKPVGYESVRAGIVYVKVAEGMKMVPKHRWVWQQHFGTVPDGFCVTFRDGNRLNCDPSNLMLITEAEKATRVTAAMTPEVEERRINKMKATQRENIRRSKLRIRWGLDPVDRRVKRWHEPDNK